MEGGGEGRGEGLVKTLRHAVTGDSGRSLVSVDLAAVGGDQSQQQS